MRTRFLAAVVVLACGLVASGATASAQTLMMLGTTVRPITVEGKNYLLADIPVFEAAVGCGRKVCVTLSGAITWGVAGGFSADVSFGDALRWYPVKYVSLFAQGRLGTLVLNNVTVLGSTGVDVEIPLGETRRLVFGVEYFNRLVTKVGGFIDGPQWYASGDGLAFRFGIGFLPRPGAGGP